MTATILVRSLSNSLNWSRYHFTYPFPISEHEAAQRTLQGSNQELERKYVRVESECQILRKIVSELDSGCRRLQRQAIEAVNAAEHGKGGRRT